MPTTLTRAETEDFAAAQAPPQAPQMLVANAAALSTPKTRRFTLKRLNRKHEVIAEAENEDTSALESPSSIISLISPNRTSSFGAEQSVAVKYSIGPQDFDLLCVIGQGAFGKVIQVRHQPTDEILAMKVGARKRVGSIWSSHSSLLILGVARLCRTSTLSSTIPCRTCRQRETL